MISNASRRSVLTALAAAPLAAAAAAAHSDPQDDPAFAAIARHRAAYAAWSRQCEVEDDLEESGVGLVIERGGYHTAVMARVGAEEKAARNDLARTIATSLAGACAMVEYARDGAIESEHGNWPAPFFDSDEEQAAFLASVAASLRALATPGPAAPAPVAATAETGRPESDPVFALIAAHKAADARLREIEDQNPEQSDPAHDAALRDLEVVESDLVSTTPRTIAGALAFIAHARTKIFLPNIDLDSGSSPATALATLERALSYMTPGGNDLPAKFSAREFIHRRERFGYQEVLGSELINSCTLTIRS